MKIIDIVNELFELEKETDKMAAQGSKNFLDYCKKTIFRRRFLIGEIDELIEKSIILSEPHFKCFWQSGYFQRWNICDTKDKYISSVKKYLDLYGKSLEKDTVMYKAIYNDSDLFGSSWTKDWKSACNFAAKMCLDSIVSMVIPKGAKTIHISPTFRFKESEDIIDTTNVINETLSEFAVFKGYKANKKNGGVIGMFLKNNGWEYDCKLDLRDSECALAKLYKRAA